MHVLRERLLPFFIFSLILLPLIFIPKTDIILFINELRTPILDALFVHASSLGNAITVVFAFLLILRFRLKWIAVFLIAFIIQVVLVLLFKKGLLAGELRPYLFFKRAGMIDMLDLIGGVKIRYINTFPSGHTATIFFLVSFFAILARNKVASWILFLVGLIVGTSRIYLLQHWYIDVYFGMLFGVMSSIMAYVWVRHHPKNWHARQIQVNLQKIVRGTESLFRQLFNF